MEAAGAGGAETKKDFVEATAVELDLGAPRDVRVHFEGTDEG